MQTTTSPFLSPDVAIEVDEGLSRTDIMTSLVLLLPGLLIAGVLFVSGATAVATWIAGGAFVVACFIAPQIGVYAYFAFQAFDAAFVTDLHSRFSPAKVLGPFLLITWLIYLGRRRADVLVSKPFITTMLLFGLFGLATASFAIRFDEAFRFSGQIIVQALMIVMAIHVLDTRRYVARAMFWTVVGGVVASLALFITGGQSSRFTRSTLGEFTNPNTTAIALSIAIAAVPAAWIMTKQKLLFPFFILAVPVMFASMLMSGSRTGLICIVIAFSVGIIFSRGTGILKRSLISLVLLLLTFGAYQFAMSTNLLGKTSEHRLEAFVFDTGAVSTDSRRYIWMMTFETFLHDPLIGVGYGNSLFANLERMGWMVDVHNDYLGALVDGGPIAFLLLAFAVWKLFQRAVRQAGGTNLGMPATVIMIVPLLSGMTHRLVFSKWYWVPVTLCLLLAEQAERERRRTEAVAALLPQASPGFK